MWGHNGGPNDGWQSVRSRVFSLFMHDARAICLLALIIHPQRYSSVRVFYAHALPWNVGYATLSARAFYFMNRRRPSDADSQTRGYITQLVSWTRPYPRMLRGYTHKLFLVRMYFFLFISCSHWAESMKFWLWRTTRNHWVQSAHTRTSYVALWCGVYVIVSQVLSTFF